MAGFSLTLPLLNAAERLGIAVGAADPVADLRTGVGRLLESGGELDLSGSLRRFREGGEIAETLTTDLERLHGHLAASGSRFLSAYVPPAAEGVWVGRVDSQDDARAFRLHQVIQPRALSEGHGEAGSVVQSPAVGTASMRRYALLGVASDTGVKNNLGNVGAKEGPLSIRKALAGLPVFSSDVGLYDMGGVCDSGSAHADSVILTQQVVADAVTALQRGGFRTVLMGGGNDLSYGHWLGLHRVFLDRRIGVINVDAHLDLRSIDERGSATSGTPFWQIGRRLKVEGQPFPYLVVGAQRAANTNRLFDTAASLGTQIVWADHLSEDQMATVQQTIWGFLQGVDQVYLTIDLDAFQAGAAPGVSAVNPDGIVPGPLFYKLFDRIVRSGKVVGFDVTEVSPPHDAPDGRTSKLAARLIHRFIQNAG